MIKFFFIFIATTLIWCTARGQYNETIRTGRPGQAIGPFTVGKGIFQNQSGADFSGIEQHNDKSNYIHTTDLNSVFRYGVIENFEVSGLINYGINSTDHYFNQAHLGVRTNIHQGKGVIPSIGLQYRMKFPFKDREFKTPNKYITSKLTLAAGQRFGKNFGLNTNLGINWISEEIPPEAFYVFSFGYSINDKWGAVAEFYGTKGIYNSFDIYNFDGGISYLVNNDLQLDLYGGYGGFETPLNTYFVSIGVSWRTKRK